MVLVIHGTADDIHRRTLDTMFEDRKRLFVDLLRWDVPVVDGRFEIDQFDDSHATYLIATDMRGTHAGSLRLLPSTRPHILGHLFPCLCDSSVPVGPAVLEITRLCLPARFHTAERLRIRNRLISALADHALEVGIEVLTGVVSARFRTEVLAMGWRADALGRPQRIGAQTLGAFAIHIDADTPQRLHAAGIYTAGMIAPPPAITRAAA